MGGRKASLGHRAKLSMAFWGPLLGKLDLLLVTVFRLACHKVIGKDSALFSPPSRALLFPLPRNRDEALLAFSTNLSRARLGVKHCALCSRQTAQ